MGSKRDTRSVSDPATAQPDTKAGSKPHNVDVDNHVGGLSLWAVLTNLSEKHPLVRVASILVGIAAAAALIDLFLGSPLVGFAVLAGMIVLIVVVLILDHLRKTASEQYKRAAQALLWFCLALFMGVCLLLVSTVFLGTPRSLRDVAGDLPLSSSLSSSSGQTLTIGRPGAITPLDIQGLPISVKTPPPIDVRPGKQRAWLSTLPSMTLLGPVRLVSATNRVVEDRLFLNNLTLENGARMITDGANVSVTMNSLTSRDGGILAFEDEMRTPLPAEPGKEGTAGKSGGEVMLEATTLTGTLHVDLSGQNGGMGHKGNTGAPGDPGSRGKNGVQGLADCRSGGGNGSPGGKGRPGFPGTKGGTPGAGGTLKIGPALAKYAANIRFRAAASTPGKGGEGGDGGPGGPGGDGGSGTLSCSGGRAAGPGPGGDPGPPGPDGAPASAGRMETLKS